MSALFFLHHWQHELHLTAGTTTTRGHDLLFTIMATGYRPSLLFNFIAAPELVCYTEGNNFIMDQKHLQELDKELAAKEVELLKQLHEVGIDNPAVPGDTEPTMPNYDLSDNTEDDRINEATDLDRNFAMHQTLEKELKEIRTTRQQIAQGKYGTCANCASPISSERLQAMPRASLCISCAQKS